MIMAIMVEACVAMLHMPLPFIKGDCFVLD